jgi:hypothetical protein
MVAGEDLNHGPLGYARGSGALGKLQQPCHLSIAARSCHHSRLKASGWLYLVGLSGFRNNQPTTWLPLSY